MDSSIDTIRRAAGLLAEARVESAMAEPQLLELATEIERAGRAADALRLSIAAELARRSDRSLGHDGLAARLGHRSPSALITSLTGVSGKQADRRARVGLLVESVTGLASAVSAGVIDTDAAESIAAALGPLADRVPSTALTHEIDQLLALAAERPADEVAAAAKSARDRLDRFGVEDRERELRSRRYLRFGRETDGMIPMHALLPPEEAGVVLALFDARTSVRRTVVFDTATDEHTTDERTTDERTTDLHALDQRTMDQRRADALVEICRVAAGTLSSDAVSSPLGNGAGTVVVTIALSDLENGGARIDGVGEPISAASARRIACNAGVLPYVLGGRSQPLDLGFSRRLFSAGQRRALGVRDRGCAAPGCDAPPGWTEAHHIVPWSRGGPSDLSNGVLLCSFHHHLVHEGRLIVEVRDGVPRVRRAELAVPLAARPG